MISLYRKYLKGYWKFIILTLVFVIVQIVFQIKLMSEMKLIIQNGVGRKDMAYIIHSGVMMLCFTLGQGLCTVGTSWFSARATTGFTQSLRRDCFKKVLAMSEQDYLVFGGGTLTTRTLADTNQLQNFTINLLRSALSVPILIVAMLIMIYLMNRMLFTILLVSFLLTIAILVFFGARARGAFRILQEKIDGLNRMVREKITGVRTIRAFGNQELEEEKSGIANEETCEAGIVANRPINFLGPASLLVMNWVMVGIYFAGNTQLQMNMVSMSSLLLIFQYVSYFIASLFIVPIMVNFMPKVSVSCERLNELLNYEEQAGRDQGQVSLENQTPGLVRKNSPSADPVPNESPADRITAGEIRFDHVIFGYSGAREVIADVTFTARAGKTTAIIGTTGSGKTTIMNLLTRLYSLTFGDITIDGTSIRDMDPAYLRSRMAYGTQRAMVYQDSVRANISAYDDAMTEDRLMAACDAACFTEVLRDLPDGLDSPMAQNGMNLSGGQRQRLSLARTIAREAPIYIFDDTFSALDARTETAVRQNVKEKLAGRTILMVAQKISTIRDADHIVVLDKGRIVGQGTHGELLETCAVYQDIERTQRYAAVKEGGVA